MSITLKVGDHVRSAFNPYAKPWRVVSVHEWGVVIRNRKSAWPLRREHFESMPLVAAARSGGDSRKRNEARSEG